MLSFVNIRFLCYIIWVHPTYDGLLPTSHKNKLSEEIFFSFCTAWREYLYRVIAKNTHHAKNCDSMKWFEQMMSDILGVGGDISSDLYRFSCLDIWISFFFKLWVRHFWTQISIRDAQIWFISIVVKLKNISLTVFMEGHFWPMSRHEN